MKQTPIARIIAVVGFFAAAALILVGRFYGSMSPIRPIDAISMMLVAVVCGVGWWLVRKNVSQGRVGMDRSQLNPLTAAGWLVLGRAAAYTGAVVGGVYLGIAIHVLPRMSSLVAAHDDAAGVVVCTLAGLAASAAGLALERACTVPPGADGVG